MKKKKNKKIKILKKINQIKTNFIKKNIKKGSLW